MAYSLNNIYFQNVYSETLATYALSSYLCIVFFMVLDY